MNLATLRIFMTLLGPQYKISRWLARNKWTFRWHAQVQNCGLKGLYIFERVYLWDISGRYFALVCLDFIVETLWLNAYAVGNKVRIEFAICDAKYMNYYFKDSIGKHALIWFILYMFVFTKNVFIQIKVWLFLCHVTYKYYSPKSKWISKTEVNKY